MIIIPSHCQLLTDSFSKKNAINTDTGISIDDKIVPNPKPVKGIPKENKIGGKMVPNKAKIGPHLRKMFKSNLINNDEYEKISTNAKPPINIQNVF